MSNLDLDAILSAVPGSGGLREDIERRARLHATLSHYAILRVPTDANEATVTEAWEKLESLCHPAHLAADLTGLTNEPWVVFARAFAAYCVLTDEGHRKAYDDQLAATAGVADRGSEHQRVFGAESNAERAEAALRKGDAFASERLAAEAVNDDPDMVGYLATLAAAHVSRGTDLATKQTLSVLDACVAHDPQFERAHVVRARIYRRSGREIEAHIEYEKALKINPNNADAQRELDAPPDSAPRPGPGGGGKSMPRPAVSGRSIPRGSDGAASVPQSAPRSARGSLPPPSSSKAPSAEQTKARTNSLGFVLVALLVVVGVGAVMMRGLPTTANHVHDLLVGGAAEAPMLASKTAVPGAFVELDSMGAVGAQGAVAALADKAKGSTPNASIDLEVRECALRYLVGLAARVKVSPPDSALKLIAALDATGQANESIWSTQQSDWTSWVAAAKSTGALH